MPPMDKSEIETQKEIPIVQTNPSTGDRRRRPLRSRTVDTLLHILSICYADASRVIQESDKGGIDIGLVTKDDAPLVSTNVVPNDALCPEEMSVEETRVVSGTQEGDSYNQHMKSAELENNVSGERKDPSHRSDTDPSNSFDNYDIVSSILRTKDQQTDMMISSPRLTTDKDVEEGEISGEFMDVLLEDDTVCKPEKENNLIPLSTDTVDDVGKDMAAFVRKTKRNLVDYSEIAVHGRIESRKLPVQGNAIIVSDSAPAHPEHVPPLRSILKNCAIKNQDLVSLLKETGAQNSNKRQGSPTEEKRTSKKLKKSVDPTACPENVTMLGQHSEGATQEAVDASANKQDDANEKKKKRVLTKERKAKKKLKDRIKRAEKNRKLGVKRLKLQPVIKEKKITYCRHYLKGRCHEGEKCKFSHDTTPLTKSKPCCHFARHACMKGDDCPFDHQLSKYPCNNYVSKGFCSRGSDCMFSHEAQPSEASLNATRESKPEQKPSSLLDNSGSKKHKHVGEMKSCSIPISSISKTEQTLVEMTPKLSARPPKGISFRSQEKLPLAQSSPDVNAEVKGGEVSRGSSDVVQDSNEITKTPPVVPRGINFLSFGKRPGSDGGFSLKIRGGIGKSPLGNLEGDSVKVDHGTVCNDDKRVDSESLPNRPNLAQKSTPIPLLPFMSSSLQKALESTLDFASKFESGRPGNSSLRL